MDAKQSKNFFAKLVEDLPATGTNESTNGQPGKSIAQPFLRETADSTLRIEVWNYTSKPYLKGDIIVVNVDNFGICRVIDALSDSGMYISNSGNNGWNTRTRPNLTRMIYATGDSSANQLASINVSVSNTISPQTKRNQYANPFNFRAGPPTLFANVHGFGYCYTDGAGANDQNKAFKMAEGLIPVAQDARLHFRIPANDTKIYNYGDPVFVAKVPGSTVFEISPNAYVHDTAIVAICDSEKITAVDYDFYMPFRLAGTLSSIDEQVGVGRGTRYGYSRDNNGDDYIDTTRGDFVYTLGGQRLYSPIYIQQYRVTAGTNYPVAVYFEMRVVSSPTMYDIPLSDSQWIANYGRGALKPEICDGDLITCLVDASGSTPYITPISFPMDYGYGVRMFFSSPPNGRLWQADIPQNNDIISINGSWHGKVVTDPNGTDLDIVGGGGIYEKITDNTVLVQGNH